MKKGLYILIFFASVMLVPCVAMGDVDVKVRVNIPLPPLIVFPAPPEVVVIPETYVYGVPDIDAEIFFYGGWWWRPWEGRWYRSRHHDRDWVYYRSVPKFYKDVPPGWRNDYRERRWRGHEWNHRRIPQRDAEKNWRGWQKNRHWEKEQTWGVKGLERRAPGQQKKVQRRGDGPPTKGGPGPQGAPGKGYRDKGKEDRR